MRFLQAGVVVFLGIMGLNCSKGSSRNEEKHESELSPQQIKQIRKEIDADKKAKLIADIIDKKIIAGFNGNVLIAQKDVVLYERSSGYASFEDTIQLNKQSKFQLASLSKTFTAVAVMKMVEDGQIGLDNTVRDYYPNFPYEGVTIRSLLSHRSGLPYYQYELDKKVRIEDVYLNNQQVMDWFSTIKPAPKLMNLPDHFFAYNNTNYAFLAAIVEKVSGKTFEQYIKEKILHPAGMFNTFTASSKDPQLNINKTFGYQHNHRIPKDYYDDILGDKGIYSTTGDLLKWYKMLKSERVLNKESLREMYTPRSFEHPGLRNYGFGFRLWVNNLQQTDYIYHTGWWKGYNTIMFFDLREDFVVILLSNKYNKGVYNIKEIVEVLHGDKKSSTIEENILDQ